MLRKRDRWLYWGKKTGVGWINIVVTTSGFYCFYVILVVRRQGNRQQTTGLGALLGGVLLIPLIFFINS